jgi:type II secretory pathway pseudopilin PulG
MMNSKGLTVMELLVTVGLLALVVLVTVPGLQSFFFRMEVHAALRTVTVALSTARTTAIRDNQPVRAEVAGSYLRLSRDDGGEWRVFRSFELGDKVAVRANGRPVFSPLGFVSPLCTITVEKQRRVWRVVLSMYGRLKVYGNG